MDLGLQGKHVLVTGGSKGIGLACARLFLEEGARVSLVSRSMGHLEQARESLRAAGVPGGERVALHPGDLADAAAAARVVEQVERAAPVDVLVNSAGAAVRTAPDELTPAHWHDAMAAKFFPCIHVMDPLIKRMAARGGGSIVNVVGRGGKVPSAIHLPGGAANAALMLVSAGLAAAYGPRGVRVNAVNPSLTLTERMEQGLQVEARLRGISVQQALAQASERMPLGRVATAEEVASAVVFLASARASYISGAILSIDGAISPMVV